MYLLIDPELAGIKNKNRHRTTIQAMGTLGIFNTGESETKNHSSILRIESTGGLALANDTGQPPMALGLHEIVVTELEAIPNMF